jgi:hypothetical protein
MAVNESARLVVSLGVSFLLGSAPTAAGEGPQIRLSGKTAPTVDVSGLSAADLAAIGALGLKGEEWSRLFAVYVEPASGKEQGPALLGSWRVEGGLLRFEPRFPLMAGVHYRAILDPARIPSRATRNEAAISSAFSLPKPITEPARLVHIYPTSDRLPENQLKFYLHFSAPMARGGVYRHIKLFEDNGKEVDVPFLELDEELWDRSHQRLTVFCDPGRIKRGLKPREEDGPVLQEGRRYILVVDTGLEDANGNHLKEPLRKTFQALPPDDTQPDPKTWRVEAPLPGTRGPVLVTFPKPLDHALLERLVWITDGKGQKMAGTVSVERDETVWRFAPGSAWVAGTYHVVGDKRLEDLAGNSIARPFEVDVFHPVQREVKTETVQVPFQVAEPRRH